MKVACVLLQSSFRIHALAEACLRFSPQVALGENTVFIEIGGSKRLFSEENFLRRMRRILDRFQVAGVVGVAEDIPTALACLQFGKIDRRELPIDALQIYANPFQHSRSLEKVIHTFKRLGVCTLGELARLPRRSMVNRFGKEALLALYNIESAAYLPWPIFTPEITIVEREEVDHFTEIKNLEPLCFLIKSMLDRIVLRLRGQLRLASALTLRITQERISIVTKRTIPITIELAFPQANATNLLAIFRERLNMHLLRQPLIAPVERLELEVVRSVYSAARQGNFFSKREEEMENFRSLVSRISDKLGAGKAFLASPVASYVPERSWRKILDEPVLENPVHLKERLPERPLRVLKQPVRIYLVHQYFLFKKRRWKILEMEGPERVSGEWWFHDKERDYFRVQTESGEELWVFREPCGGEYFLHGVFD